MPWVCTCGQRNIVSGLPCLACDRVEQKAEPRAGGHFAAASPTPTGSRFREDPSAEVEPEAEPVRRFRFTVSEPDAVDEPQPAAPVASTGRRFSFTPEPEVISEPVIAAVDEVPPVVFATPEPATPAPDFAAPETDFAAAETISPDFTALETIRTETIAPESLAEVAPTSPDLDDVWANDWFTPEAPASAGDAHPIDQFFDVPLLEPADDGARAAASVEDGPELEPAAPNAERTVPEWDYNAWYSDDIVTAAPAPVAPNEAESVPAGSEDQTVASAEGAPLVDGTGLDQWLDDESWFTPVPTASDPAEVAEVVPTSPPEDDPWASFVPSDIDDDDPWAWEPQALHPAPPAPAFEPAELAPELAEPAELGTEQAVSESEPVDEFDFDALFPSPWTVAHDAAVSADSQQDDTGEAAADAASADASPTEDDWSTSSLDWPADLDAWAADAEADEPFAAQFNAPAVNAEVGDYDDVSDDVFDDDAFEARTDAAAVPPTAAPAPQRLQVTFPSSNVDADEDDDAAKPWWLGQSSGFGFGGAPGNDTTEAHFDASQLEPQGYQAENFRADFDFDDEDDLAAYPAVAAAQRQHIDGDVSHFFTDDDVDLDEPDDYETAEDSWATPSRNRSARPERNSREQNREPEEKGRRTRRPAQRGATSRPAGRDDKRRPARATQDRLPINFADPRAKIAIVLLIVILAGVSLTVGKGVFTKVAAPSANAELVSAGTETCATVKDSSSTKGAGLQQLLAAAPSGFTTREDFEAGTGAVDFARALKREPDPASALSTLDQTRFLRGYDRAFKGDNNAAASVAVYQFAGAVCATDYVMIEAQVAASAQRFDVPEVPGAVGTIETINGTKTYLVRSPRGNRALLATYSGGSSPEASVQAVKALAKAQYDKLV